MDTTKLLSAREAREKALQNKQRIEDDEFQGTIRAINEAIEEGKTRLRYPRVHHRVTETLQGWGYKITVFKNLSPDKSYIEIDFSKDLDDKEGYTDEPTTNEC